MRILSKKIGRNLIGYSYSQIITITAQIVVVPFFLAAWGVQQYGEWLVVTGALMFLSLMELGVAQASATRATLAAGAGDLKAVRVSLDTAMAFSVAAAGLVVIMAYLLSLMFPWSVLLSLSSISTQQAGMIFLAMSGCLASGFVVGAVAAWLKAVDKTALSAFLIAHRRAVDMVVTATSLLLAATPLQLAMALLLTSIATMLACYIWASRISTIGIVTLRHASWSELRTVFYPSLAYMAYPLAQTITLQGGVQMMNYLTNASTVVAFTMARTMVRLIMQVGMVFSNSIRPEVSRLLGGENKAQAIKLIIRASALAASLAIIGLFGIATMGPWMIHIWSSGEVVLPASLLSLLALHAVINVLWYVPATYMFSINRHTQIAWAYMCISILGIISWRLFFGQEPMLEAALVMLCIELLTAVYLIQLWLSASTSLKTHRINNKFN